MNAPTLPAHVQDTIRSLTAAADAGGPHAAHARAELDRLADAKVADKTIAHAPLPEEEAVLIACTAPGRCPSRTVPASRAATACEGPCPSCGRMTLRLASDLPGPLPEERPEDYAAAVAALPPLPPTTTKHLGDVVRDLMQKAATSAPAARELLALRAALAAGLSAQGLAHPVAALASPTAAPRATSPVLRPPQPYSTPPHGADRPAPSGEGPVQT